MSYFRNCYTLVWIACLLVASAPSAEVAVQNPKPPRFVGPILRPFHLEKRIVAPAKLTNSPRLESLVRSGNLYLSAQDVIALALENNLDIAIQRYGPFLAREVLRRAEAGQLLRSVDTPVAAGPTSVSTAGVSTNGNGLGGAGLASGAGLVTGIGQNPPNLDPNIFINAQFGHQTTPQSNTSFVGTTSLTNNYRYLQFGYSQSFVTNTFIQFVGQTTRSNYNSSTYLFNPSINGYFDFQVNQPLLQGFGSGVNDRYIKVAKNNMKITDMQMKLQVATTISAVLNLYWDLVSFNDAVRIKEQALTTAQNLLEGNKKQVSIGALPAVEVTRAAAEVSASKEDLLIAQTNVAQQEIVLKNALNRNGLENTWLDDVHIIPLDRIEVPQTEEIQPIQDLLQEALTNRQDILQSQVNVESAKFLARGDKNSLLPSLSAFAELTNHGLAGPVNSLYSNCCGEPNPFFVGGLGSVFSQLFRRNFPDYSAGLAFTIPIRNRSAQADYVTDELQLRQRELTLQRSINQVRVDVKTSVIGLQQARTRYQTAVDTRVLAEQSLKNEQSRFQYGVSTVALVIQAQKDLATNQDAEVQAMANYTHAKIAYDFALGRTLDVNHISMEEARSGQVQRDSRIPDSVPGAKNPGAAKSPLAPLLKPELQQ
jgi:outer membrane protein TolC